MPQHVVVDGSNIATEGRSIPSLKQLNEAVLAFIEEHPDALITVVVDATFGHRIDSKELAEFDEAVNNNELVAPPAGAVGRGDAFVLSIAHKVGAIILSNDSFQEFHGQYTWLFDEGRLIGGKPVPHIGWVFVPRVPVRGNISRKAVQVAKRKDGGGGGAAKRQASKEASLPMPVPVAPPPGAQLRPKSEPKAVAATPTAVPARGGAVNDLLPFITFVEQHPVGSSVNAVVENYSSHGAYVRIGDVRGYIPLRLMADPMPRSARELMKIGDAVTVVVESFAAARRSIDLAVPTMATAKLIVTPTVAKPAPRKRTVKKAAAAIAPDPAGEVPSPVDVPIVAAEPELVAELAPAKPAKPVRKRTAKRPIAAVKAVEPPPAPVAKRAAATPKRPRKQATAKLEPAPAVVEPEIEPAAKKPRSPRRPRSTS